MPTAESRVAAVLNITELEAQDFLAQVWFGLDRPPRDVWFARCLEEFPRHPPHARGRECVRVIIWWQPDGEKSGGAADCVLGVNCRPIMGQ